jgi:hypothetical protein
VCLHYVVYDFKVFFYVDVLLNLILLVVLWVLYIVFEMICMFDQYKTWGSHYI